VSGEEQFEELYDWVNQELYRPTQIYRLDRAAVFNNRCPASESWCGSFTMTNLLDWGSGIYATQVPTIRGAYFMNQMALLSMMYQPEEKEMEPQLEPFDPYPFAE
jgi:hypothetical protein